MNLEAAKLVAVFVGTTAASAAAVGVAVQKLIIEPANKQNPGHVPSTGSFAEIYSNLMK